MLPMTAAHSDLASCAFEMLVRKHASLPVTGMPLLTGIIQDWDPRTIIPTKE